MDSPSSIEVPRPVGKGILHTMLYSLQASPSFHLGDNSEKSRASGTRKKTSERGRVTRECHA